MFNATTKGKQMKHAYRPLAFFGGKVLKYAGMVQESNIETWAKEWARPEPPYLAGVVFLDEYRGDKINSPQSA
jgi:hypothetical protein